jgi:hypothetical protein
VKDLGFSPVDKTEWVPFIHALAVTGETEKAEELSEHVLEQEGTKPLICATWAEIILENSQATIKDNVTKKFGVINFYDIQKRIFFRLYKKQLFVQSNYSFSCYIFIWFLC